jgi:hypothetical protein
MEIVTALEQVEWRDRAIRATRKAIEAAEAYDEAKPGVVAHIKQNPRIYGKEDFALRKALENNWTLADHARVHAFQRDLANMLWTALATLERES